MQIANQQKSQSLLSRPPEQRLREYKYRFAQSVVFGLPVLGLQIWGLSLGGEEAGRWVGILQALLAGWVVYVGAAGMFFEGLLLLKQKLTGDLLIAAISIIAYLVSIASVLHILINGHPWFNPLFFHWSVILIAIWTAWQWHIMARRLQTP